MAPLLRRLWDEMPEPKWALALGSCASGGGPYHTYAVLPGVEGVIPVDVHVPGCPPRPEALLAGLLELETRIGPAGGPGVSGSLAAAWPDLGDAVEPMAAALREELGDAIEAGADPARGTS